MTKNISRLMENLTFVAFWAGLLGAIFFFVSAGALGAIAIWGLLVSGFVFFVASYVLCTRRA